VIGNVSVELLPPDNTVTPSRNGFSLIACPELYDLTLVDAIPRSSVKTVVSSSLANLPSVRLKFTGMPACLMGRPPLYSCAVTRTESSDGLCGWYAKRKSLDDDSRTSSAAPAGAAFATAMAETSKTINKIELMLVDDLLIVSPHVNTLRAAFKRLSDVKCMQAPAENLCFNVINSYKFRRNNCFYK
jgi:hypothetical protein